MSYPLNMLAKSRVDVRLVSASITSASPEPGYDVRIKPQCDLLLHGAIEYTSPGIRPVENLRGLGRVDLVPRQSIQRPYLLLNV